jgi:hypothetical protein
MLHTSCPLEYFIPAVKLIEKKCKTWVSRNCQRRNFEWAPIDEMSLYVLLYVETSLILK